MSKTPSCKRDHRDLLWCGKTRVTSYELQVAIYELLVTSSTLEGTSWNSKLRVQIHEFNEFKFTSCEFNFMSYESLKTSSFNIYIYIYIYIYI